MSVTTFPGPGAAPPPPQPSPNPQEDQRAAQQAIFDQLDSTTAVAGGGPVERIINIDGQGKTVLFAELSFYDRRELLREWRKVMRAELQNNLTATGITGAQAFVELREFDQATRLGGEGLWVRFFESDDGKLNILTWSLRKAQALNGWPPDPPALEAEVQKVIKAVASKWPEVSRLAAVLTHTPIFADQLKAPPPKAPEKQADPTPPPSAPLPQGGQTETQEQPPPKGFGKL